MISLSKLQQIDEIDKFFQHLQRALHINRSRDNPEPGGTWDEFLVYSDEGLAAKVVKKPAATVLSMIEAEAKGEMNDY